MNKNEVMTQRKLPLKLRAKLFWRNLWWGWLTRHIWDMPKKQPCPSCHGQKPRTSKLVGAVYHCNKCRKDFVGWKKVNIK